MGKLVLRVGRWQKVRIGETVIRFRKRHDRLGQIVIEVDAPREVEVELIKPVRPDQGNQTS